MESAADARACPAAARLMRTRIKICGITRVEDAHVAVTAGADALGVVFWPQTPRCVTIERAREIAAVLPPFVTLVGLFVDPKASEVLATLDAVTLDTLQFHGDEAPEFCRDFKRPYVKAVAVKASEDLLQYAARYPDARGLLFDAHQPGGMPGGTGTTFDWTRLPRDLMQPVILSGGLTPENVGVAIRQVKPWAVDVSSGVEANGADGRPRKGIKDAAKIAAFIAEARNADVRTS
jgi:phosphoribosylanthranilate isomerase